MSLLWEMSCSNKATFSFSLGGQSSRSLCFRQRVTVPKSPSLFLYQWLQHEIFIHIDDDATDADADAATRNVKN